MLIVGYLVNLMVMFNEVEMAIWSFLMASLHVVSKLWWLIVGYLVNLMVMFYEVEMAIWSFLMASLHVVSKLWWSIVDLMVDLMVIFHKVEMSIGYLKFLHGKSTRGVQIMMVNSKGNPWEVKLLPLLSGTQLLQPGPICSSLDAQTMSSSGYYSDSSHGSSYEGSYEYGGSSSSSGSGYSSSSSEEGLENFYIAKGQLYLRSI